MRVPVLASFARAGSDTAGTYGPVPLLERLGLPPFADWAKDGAPQYWWLPATSRVWATRRWTSSRSNYRKQTPKNACILC